MMNDDGLEGSEEKKFQGKLEEENIFPELNSSLFHSLNSIRVSEENKRKRMKREKKEKIANQ